MNGSRTVTGKRLMLAAAAALVGSAFLFAGQAAAAPCNNNTAPGGWSAIDSSSSLNSELLTSFQGYSRQAPRSPDGQGTSSITQVTPTTTTTHRQPGSSPNPQTCETKETGDTYYEFEGPGNSPAEQLLGDRV